MARTLVHSGIRSQVPPRARASHPTARDFAAAFRVLGRMGEGCPSPLEFARRGVTLLPGLVASEITTLSICDLTNGRRRVVTSPGHALGADALEAFDRHFFAHPLVCFHKSNPDGGVHRISDSLSAARFQATPLYADYYLRVGLDHSLALPLYVDAETLVSFVFNRQRLNFGDPERDLLEQMRPVLADLFRTSVMLAQWRAKGVRQGPANLTGRFAEPVLRGDPLFALTSREREVLGWVTAGKTNAQIATIVGASPRTVAKHLERIYEKLGVESRTAAAMRVAPRSGSGTATPITPRVRCRT
jgi:DNA-binding CsgD family transcriptional regulator